MNYADGIAKIVHPRNRTPEIFIKNEKISGKNEYQSESNTLDKINENLNSELKDKIFYKNLDGFMIGRASFGNPWCFLPGNYEPTFAEILDTMEAHGSLLWEWKERKGMMEARKHLVQYLHGFPGVKEYRSELVHVESVSDIMKVISDIRIAHPSLLEKKISSYNPESAMAVW